MNLIEMPQTLIQNTSNNADLQFIRTNLYNMANITYQGYANITNNLDNLYMRNFDLHYFKDIKTTIYGSIILFTLFIISVLYILYIRSSFKCLFEKISLVHKLLLNRRLTELKKLS